jgi:hypothetical protein
VAVEKFRRLPRHFESHTATQARSLNRFHKVFDSQVPPMRGHWPSPILKLILSSLIRWVDCVTADASDNGDLYGKTLELIFVKKLRDERKFPSLEELREQIARDISKAQSEF